MSRLMLTPTGVAHMIKRGLKSCYLPGMREEKQRALSAMFMDLAQGRSIDEENGQDLKAAGDTRWLSDLADTLL